MYTIGTMVDISKGGSVSPVSGKEHTWRYIGSAYIVDDDGDRIDPHDIAEKGKLIAARGNGKVIITFGHQDMPVGLGTVPELVEIKDKEGVNIPAVMLEVEYPDFGPTSHAVWKAHEEGRVHGLSIKGRLVSKGDAQVVCDDTQCSSMHREIRKAEWFGFALCVDDVHPRNRLATVLKGGAVVKDPDDCPICNEAREYYREAGLEEDEVEILIKGMLEAADHQEDKDMEKEELDKALSEFLGEMKAVRDDILKANTPAPEPEDTTPATEPEGTLTKADVENMLGDFKREILELMKGATEKADEPEKEADTPDADAPDTPDVNKGVEEPADKPEEPETPPETGETDPVPADVSKGGLKPDTKGKKVTPEDVLASMFA